jgi:peptidyl-prolyl cis-trans isomerase B (cyclophilin B)
MNRIPATFLASVLATFTSAQEIPGVKVTMDTRSLVTSGANVELRMLIQVDKDAELPSQLLNGASLTVKCDDQAQKPIQQAGKGGAVALAAGTRIERTLTFPAVSFLPKPDLATAASVVVGWEGMAGVGCTFRVAPDTKNVDISTLDLAKTQVVLVTNFGDMTLEFRPDKAPKHVENFVKLCLQGFYDGTKFHRVIRDFMIQGGCPNTKDDSKKDLWGSGGPGYTLNAEFSDLRHLRGTLSMARTDQPNTAGSGFFICHKDCPQLDNQYTTFGAITSGGGIDVVDRIATTRVGGPQNSAPMQPVILISAVVLPVKK